MCIKTRKELEALREVGRVVRKVLLEMKKRVRPGITTLELDRIGAQVLAENEARSAPAVVYGFPGTTCISINDEIVHGIPSEREIQPGDLVKIDVTAEKNGYIADAALTVPVEPVTQENRRLVDLTVEAFHQAMGAARAGNRINLIGRAVESTVTSGGFSVFRELTGHGVGRTIHEEPVIPNYEPKQPLPILTRGLVITVEPMVDVGSGGVIKADDGWTFKTADGTPSAHYEHTLVITEQAPVILTAG